MKYLKKTLSFVLAFAMMFTMVIVPKTSVANAATSDYNYFDTTMFNYDTDTFNAATKALEKNGQQGIYFNDGGMTTNISHENINNSDYNIWTGQPGKNGKEYAYTGLVKSDLDKSGNIQFNYPQAGIFDTTKTTGKNTYTNVKMPFKKDSDGYYYYDSYKYDVKFPNNKPANNAKLEDEGLSKLSSDGKGAFLPFSKNTSRNVDSNPTFHFGMDMSVKFYMPENGQITTSDGSKKDMTFEFSGDDDVWVFVDGKLVLDIGGIHNAIKGDINFNKGVATVYKGQTNASVTTTDIYTSNVLGTNWKNETNKVHTLQVFYLERGRGESNCKIKFNLEIKDQLQVTKSLGNKAEDDKDLKALLSNRFNFKIYSSEDKTNYTAYKNKKYYIPAKNKTEQAFEKYWNNIKKFD
jgi:fibro-slime domain-containing protein